MPSVPKPVTVEKVRKYLPRSTKPLKRSWLKRGTKQIPSVNGKRMARRKASYAKVLASDFHKQLRYKAWERAEGRCECEQCVRYRSAAVRKISLAEANDWVKAGYQIPVWFIHSGAEPYKRFRSKDGELHHDSYKYFGDENPAELQHVRWVWKECHKRIEAEKGTRNRYLRGLKK